MVRSLFPMLAVPPYRVKAPGNNSSKGRIAYAK